MTNQAPLNDILSALKAASVLNAAMMNGVGALDEARIRAISDEAGTFGSEVHNPLDHIGDVPLWARALLSRVKT